MSHLGQQRQTFPHKQSAGSWIQPLQVTQPKETNIYKWAAQPRHQSWSYYSLQKRAKQKSSIALAVMFKGKVKMGSTAANWSVGWSSRLCLAWQHHSGGKKGVSKGKAERRGRGKKEKPTSETRDVHGTNHTQGNGCREAPEPLDIVLIPASFLTVFPFPEAVDLRDALGMMTFLPRNSLSLSRVGQ